MTLRTEDVLERILDVAPGHLLVVDAEARLHHWSSELPALLGMDPSELEGRPVDELVRPEDRGRISSLLTWSSSMAKITLRSARGEEVSVHATALGSPNLDDPIRVLHLMDFADQHWFRRAQQEQLDFQSLASDLSTSLLSRPASDAHAILRRHLSRIADAFGADRLAVWKRDPDHAHRLRVLMTWSARDVPPPAEDLTSDDLPDIADRLLAGESLLLNTVPDGPDPDPVVAPPPDASLLAPVRIGGSVIAMLVLDTCGRAAAWDDDHVSRAKVIAGVIAGAFKRLQFDQSQTDAYDRIAQLKDQLEAESTVLREEISLQHDHGEIVGQSEALQTSLFRAEQVAPTDVTVLIQGETGVGKELFARAVHRASRRHMHPLVTVNCAALPPTLIESELFGHERGAFTGAEGRRVGRFEIADGGTLFLDEIGEIPLDLQAKLLRVLQLGEFERLGSSATQSADVRIIAATNRDLEAEVAAGRFREDLWYRLNVFPIRVPPLRERREDIPALAVFFLGRLTSKVGRGDLDLPRPALNALTAYDWPGNVRELENVIERGVITSTGDEFRLADPLASRGLDIASDALRPLAEVEREHLLRVLRDRGWRIEGPQGAAAVLGLNPSTLRARLRKHGIVRPTG